jgi:hypothetical protein
MCTAGPEDRPGPARSRLSRPWFVVVGLALGLLIPASPGCKTGGSARITKVLPHLLDAEGRNSPAPSLYERDAYQAWLRAHPEEVHGLRFDVRWRSTVYYLEGLKLRLEVRGSRQPQELVLEQTFETRPWYQRWSSFTFDRQAFSELGEVIGWRATLWDGDRLLAEQKSFLW